MKTIQSVLLLTLLYIAAQTHAAPNNLATTGKASSNANDNQSDPQLAIDGNVDTHWISRSPDGEKWLTVELPGNTEVTEIAVQIDTTDRMAPSSFAFQTYMNGRWKDVARRDYQPNQPLSVKLGKPMLTDTMRVTFFDAAEVAVKELQVYGIEYTADLTQLKDAIINQSGYNLGQPKRFTAPKYPDATPFHIVDKNTGKRVFEGKIHKHIGDFSAFDPESSHEFVIRIADTESFPFRIGPYWLERVSYQNMMDFMRDVRHYVGSTNALSRFSWEWRDGDFFNWAQQTLTAQYLSNPAAYQRLNKDISYVENASFPAEYKGLWGKLEPYDESAPDIVKLIHWDVDVKISQALEHEHQKAELAHFLAAYPYLKQWLPQQNFDAVYSYAKDKWEKPTVREDSTTKYDKSESHNLLALKTKMGTNKGELPPGASVIPNLMMYEVAKPQGEADADKYFEAAYRQMKWMIANLDWKDPMTTKGQRMSEHITLRSFAYFFHQYPDRAPAGLQDKVAQWAEVMIRRSDNMWDFRKYTDDAEWAPLGWNETGNILGFPAAALSAKSVVSQDELKTHLDILAWSHFDNGFGRNPLGRHSSFDGPKEIEGVDLGWFNAHKGGIGLLEPVPFVFDGSPKAEHFPNNPELGNIGWTEGWVQFNIAFNVAMAYLAHDSVDIELSQTKAKTIEIRLAAPLNFHEDQIDRVEVILRDSKGNAIPVILKEEGKFSKYLSGSVRLKKEKINSGDQVSVSYGLGYFEKKATLKIK